MKQTVYAAALIFGLAGICLIAVGGISANSGQPDLTIENFTVEPTHLAAGAAFTTALTVKNVGSAAASGFAVRLYVDPADAPPLSGTPATDEAFFGIPLAAGGSWHWSQSNDVLTQAGSYPVYAWVDPTGQVAEADESNNLVGPIMVTVTDPVDDYEDDNSCEQANLLPADGTPQYRTFSPAPEADWVKLDTVGGVTYRVEALVDGRDTGAVIDQPGACQAPPSLGGESVVTFTARVDGLYYLKIRPDRTGYGIDTAYRLRATVQTDCAGFEEPNDSLAMAGDILVSDTAVQSHSFCRPADEDWVRFPVQAGAGYRLTATGTGPAANPWLSLSVGGEVLTGSQITFTPPRSGWLYARAANQESDRFGANSGYTLQLRQVDDGCRADSFEGDDTPAQAAPVTINAAPQTRHICPAGDTDWATFRAEAGQSYTIETLELGDQADTVLCLYDAAGSQRLVCDDDSGPGSGSRLIWQAPATGDYSLRLRHFSREVAGPDTHYRLQIRTDRCQPDSLEPDDSPAAASSLTAGTEQDHNFCEAADEDWVAFRPGTGPYLIETANLGPEADTVIELYDDNRRLLAANDDYHLGLASRLVYTFTAAGDYYLRLRPYNPARYGSGAAYSLRLSPGLPPATPVTTPTTVLPVSTRPISRDIKSLILVNRSRVADLYGESTATALMDKLDTLRSHPQVYGELIDLDKNAAVRTAYAAWQADPTDVAGANGAAAAIRGLVRQYLDQYRGVEYLVLVGDDRIIPFRRLPDNTPNPDFQEQNYPWVDGSTGVGAALQANYFLSDDFYAARTPKIFSWGELYVPDLSLGRLVETPAEIMAVIDHFLANPETDANQALITGWDFFQDVAGENCRYWQAELGSAGVDCSLLDNDWPSGQYRALHLAANPPFEIHSINGHATHFESIAPQAAETITAGEVAAASGDLAGALIYMSGCQSGLNLPPDNPFQPLDLAQAFSQQRAAYVGNTGYSWGLPQNIGLSETLVRLYTDELYRYQRVGMGQALMRAKRRYYLENPSMDVYSQKVMQQYTFYGLPMRYLNTGGAFSGDDPFPDVAVDLKPPAGSFGDEVLTGTLDLQLTGNSFSDVVSRTVTKDGVYYALGDSIQTAPGEPIQPLFYAAIPPAGGKTLRSVLFLGGEYEPEHGFDPVIVSPVNDYLTQTVEASFEQTLHWYPPLPLGWRIHEGESRFVTLLGQYNPTQQQARLYSRLSAALYYSASPDDIAPEISLVDGYYDPTDQMIHFKVGAVDASGIARVVVSYTDQNGLWQSFDLSFESGLYKWTGTLPAAQSIRYLVQAVDGAGNLTVSANKGLYFEPGVLPAGEQLHLPLILK